MSKVTDLQDLLALDVCLKTLITNRTIAEYAASHPNISVLNNAVNFTKDVRNGVYNSYSDEDYERLLSAVNRDSQAFEAMFGSVPEYHGQSIKLMTRMLSAVSELQECMYAFIASIGGVHALDYCLAENLTDADINPDMHSELAKELALIKARLAQSQADSEPAVEVQTEEDENVADEESSDEPVIEEAAADDAAVSERSVTESFEEEDASEQESVVVDDESETIS